MGHAAYAMNGIDRHKAGSCPFQTVEAVWAFDVVSEYGLPVFKDQLQRYEQTVHHLRERFPNQLTTGGYYKSIISGVLESFGWEKLLMALCQLWTMDPFAVVSNRHRVFRV
jgi:hypothetical protein